MNVLLLSGGYRAFDDRVRIDFIKKLSGLCYLKIYGPNEYELNRNFAPVKYNSKITSHDLKMLFNPDILLFLLYAPEAYINLTNQICKLGIPSVIREEDHYYKNLEYNNIDLFKWYKSMDFTLLMRRHFYEEEPPIPSVWTPPSVNEDEFIISSNINRESKIGFAGSYVGYEHYDIRRNAIKILRNNKLLASSWGKKCGSSYINYLHRYVGCLACSCGQIHTCLAKTFEISLCGTAVLTNWMHNKKELFGDKQCFFEYKDDCSDLVDVANTVINDVDLRNEVISNAIEVIHEKHTDKKRIVEYYNILKAVADGKEPPRVWGQ